MEKIALINGKIYVERDVFAQALLAEGGIITAVGTDREILALAGDAPVYDCGGRTVLPGLNDSHQHLLQVGESLANVDLSDCVSIDDMVQRCRDFVAQHPETEKTGLHAMGWNQDLFTDSQRIPTRHDMDRISTRFPVVLERVCGHILTTNTCAIERLGLTAKSPQYEGGVFEIGEDGMPNGIFAENACQYARDLVPGFTLAQHEALMLQAMEYAVAHGLTSVQSNDAGTSTTEDARFFTMMRQLYAQNRAPLRYRHQVCCVKPDDLRAFLASGERENAAYSGDSWLTMGPLKLFKDGSLGARTATMREAYRDDPGNFGVECTSDDQMDLFCRIAADAGMQIITHVIGDDAISRTLDSYEKVLVKGKNPLRHGLVHCQITDRPLLQRIADMDVAAFYQPIFLDYDMHIVESRCGAALASTSYAFRTLPALGAHVSYGTDAPVEDCNPFPNLCCAVTRTDKNGQPVGGFVPTEKVDVFQAVDAYTAGSAWCEFMEDVKGRLKKGYLADLTVLDTDIFTCPPQQIRGILPVMTMVDGKIVYQK